MELILVRHGSRYEDARGELNDHGQHQIVQLAHALQHRGSAVDCVLTSRHSHARQTADLLRTELSAGAAPLHELDSLTPQHGPGDIDTLIDEATAAEPGLQHRHCVVLVGHEGRLSDLLTELTATRARPLGHGEAVSIGGDCLQDLIAGNGRVRYRYPVYDHQDTQLQSKVQSKMSVSTFLAGFVFTALSSLLVLNPDHWIAAHVIAVITLTCSLMLYVACVYIYDQLGMPTGFWTDAPPARWKDLTERFERRRERRWHAVAATHGPETADEQLRPWLQDGPRYHLMISTSRWLFTPATTAALAGFLALLKGTQDLRIFLGACAGLVLAGAFALARRPALGAD